MISVRYFCQILMSTAAWLCHNVFTILFWKCSMTRELMNTWYLWLNNTGRQWVGESTEKISYIAQQGSHTAVRWSTKEQDPLLNYFYPELRGRIPPNTHLVAAFSARHESSSPTPAKGPSHSVLPVFKSDLWSFANRSHTMITATTKTLTQIRIIIFFRLADTVCWHNHKVTIVKFLFQGF